MTQNRLMRLERFMDEHVDEVIRQGSVQATYRVYKDERFGPFYRVIFRCSDGRQRTFYLGKDSDLVEYARELLRNIQASGKADIAARRRRKQIVRFIRDSKKELERELGKYGLRLHGWELRRALPRTD